MKTKLFFISLFIICSIAQGQIINTFAGTGTAGFSGDGGPATSAQLYRPAGLTIDGAGNIYIADRANNCVRRVTPAGIISIFAGTGVQGFSGDGGPATSAQLYIPSGLTIDGAGNIYISDGNSRVRRVTPGGIISTFAGTGSLGFNGDGGPAVNAALQFPTGLTTDGVGNIYIADQSNHRIRRVSPSGIISTFAGIGVQGFSGDGGPATSAQLSYPTAVTIDGGGNIYIADYNNNRVRRITPAGIISTFAGTGVAGFSGDGGAAVNAKLNLPSGLSIDGAGNIYIADYYNHLVRRVTPAGIISTFAGTGVAGFSGDGGPATSAKLNGPWALTIDGAGNVYIADYSNYRVRRVTPAGIISTFAGTGIWGFSGDGGPATNAQISAPTGLTVDAGNIYIADRDNNSVRRVTQTGIISTFAGTGVQGFSGDGGAATGAQLYHPTALTTDGAGNIYIAEEDNHLVRKVTPAGIISTFAGTGIGGFSGDGGLATSAQLNTPEGLTVDGMGSIYIADWGNGRVRKVNNPTTGINTQNAPNAQISLYPNPVTNKLNIATQTEFLNSEIEIKNTLGQTVIKSFFKKEIDVSNLASGFYTFQLTNSNNQTFVNKFIKE